MDTAAKIGRALDTPITYARFPQQLLDQSPQLARLVEFVDAVDAVGRADIPALRRLWPGLLTLDAWLEREGAAKVRALLGE